MCGITGILSFQEKFRVKKLLSFNECQLHRGPDDNGYLILEDLNKKPISFSVNDNTHNKDFTSILSTNIQFGIAHTRFSIQDISTKGHQPMTFEDRYALTFNGEVFNFIEIRNKLKNKGYKFNSSSDTEVVIKSYAEWGTKCFNMFNGFWALAIFDLKKQEIILSRDRFGQKPLYYYENNNFFYFSSEIKSIRSLCPELNTVDSRSAYLYLYHDRRDSLTSTMYENLKMIKPSTFTVINLNNKKRVSKRYWNYPNVRESVHQLTEKNLSKKLEKLINQAVKIRLRSDVPIAANLSGGLDSATIVYHASKILSGDNKKLTTHTFEYNESKNLSEKNEASLIAKNCGTNHSVLEFQSSDIWIQLTELVRIIEEPVHNPAAYIQWLGWKKISELGYKVIIHGSANDELMMGYSYFSEIEDKRRIKSLKIPLRMQGNSILYYKNILRLLKWSIKFILRYFSFINSDYNQNSQVFNKTFLENNTKTHKKINSIINNAKSGEDRRLVDFKYLRIPFWNNFMDKSMMSLPVEVRLPFLDKKLVEFCFKHGSNIFYKNGWPKYILRKSIENKLPNQIVWSNRKKGFTSPLANWLEENKHKNIKIINSNSRIKKYIDTDYITKNYDTINLNLLWRVINFSIWINEFNLKIN